MGSYSRNHHHHRHHRDNMQNGFVEQDYQMNTLPVRPIRQENYMIPTGSNLQGSNMQRDRSISRSSSSSSDRNRNVAMVGQTGNVDTLGNSGLVEPGIGTGNIQSGYG